MNVCAAPASILTITGQKLLGVSCNATVNQGRYAVERELGEGGMATVYLAADLKLRIGG